MLSTCFQRGSERVTLSHREHARGVTLVVSGHGDLRSYSFHDLATLLKFECVMEDFLLSTGWSPAELTIKPRLSTPRTWPPPAQRAHKASQP